MKRFPIPWLAVAAVVALGCLVFAVGLNQHRTGGINNLSGWASLVAAAALVVALSKYAYSRGRAAASMAEQAQRLRTTLASIGDAVIVTDEAGRVSNMNPVAEDLTGWAGADAAEQPLDRVFHIINEDSREAVENPATRALREGKVVGLANHTVLVAKDGRERPIDDSAAPVKDAQGNVSGVVLVFRDVTERRATEKAQAVLASIVEASDDAIVSKTLDGIITSWNSGAERLFGVAADEAVGQSINLIIPTELRDEEKSILARLRKGERISHFETVRMHKSGRRIHISLTVSPLRDGAGRIIGASKVARDITGRIKSEADTRFLAEASASLAKVFDYNAALRTVAKLAVPSFADWCAIDMLDATGKLERVAVAHVDPAKVDLAYELQRRFPTNPDEPQGAWNIVRTGRSEMVEEISDEMLEASVKDEDLLRVIRELGLKSYMGAPIEVSGKVLGVITFISAESGRRYDAQDLAVAEDLAHRAAVAIQNAQLFGELREAGTQKDRFLATLAHELRNPLAPIRYSLELAKSSGFDPQHLPRVHETIERQLGQLVRLVDDLLDVSRITRDRLELRRTKTELASVVHQAVESVRPLVESKGLNFKVTLPGEHIYLDSDPTRIAQVFTNVLNNACKFNHQGGNVALSARRDGEEAVITVKDDGVGIAADVLPHIFDMFAQGAASIEGSQGGLGIGLTLTRRLVEMHGGVIEATSEGLGKGAEFIVRLPLFVPSRADDAAGDSEVQPVGEHGGTGEKTTRILVVDDNKDAAESLVILLAMDGYAAQLASDGAAALAAAEEFRPDVVLLDIGMPVMSGYEAARAIRSKPWGQRPILVAVTGWGQEQDRLKSREAGFDFHLVKPVGRKELTKLLGDLSAQARS